MPPLSPDRWRAVAPYLDDALDMTKEERKAFLATIKSRDTILAADLHTLLVEHALIHDSGFLERTAPLPENAGMSFSLAGQVLGAYRLLTRIGQGGMGTVWLAERCDGRYEGRVAIKLLNVALLGRAGEERFRREGEILARLKHPNIAHLLDAGVSPTGHPYLVLEHVEGQRIDRYCDDRGLDLQARLRLFIDVLEAVSHAHANLIVHRDLKPANVLVTPNGKVKLLDFGIAKLLEADAQSGASLPAETSALTREAGSALTPEYAAPEQVTGGQVTTATDVYALGVLLYVMLGGEHPAGSGLRSPADLMRAIVDTEPRRMSDVVVARSDLPLMREHHAERLGTTPPRLRRLLQGDLDVIVAKALKKTAPERYSSVSALADDLRRYLNNEPISARPDTLRYRTTKFVRRHVQGVLGTIAVVLLIGGLTFFYTNRLAAERDRARLEADKAAKISAFLTSLLAPNDPYSTPAIQGTPTVRGLLDVSTERVQKELAGQPELQAELLTTVGRIYRRLGAYDKARPLLEKALVLGTQVFGTDARMAQSIHDIGILQGETGDYEVGTRTLEKALEMRRQVLGPEHKDVAITLVELGRFYQDQGFNRRSEPLHREALAIRSKVLGPTDRETATSMSDVASVMRLKGDLDGAEKILRECMELNRKALGEEHPNFFTTIHDLAVIALQRGNAAEAEAMVRSILPRAYTALGSMHPTMAAIQNTLASALRKQGKYEGAAIALQEAVQVARTAHGAEHPLVGIYSANLGSVYMALKRPELAEPLLRKAVEIRTHIPGVVPSRRRTLPEDDWSVGDTKRLLGAALNALARPEEAQAVLLDRP